MPLKDAIYGQEGLCARSNYKEIDLVAYDVHLTWRRDIARHINAATKWSPEGAFQIGDP